MKAAKELIQEGKIDDGIDIVSGTMSALFSRVAELELLLKNARAKGKNGPSEQLNPAQLSLLDALIEAAKAGVDPDVEIPAELVPAFDAELDEEIEAAKEAARAAGEAAEAEVDPAKPAVKRKRNLHLESLEVVETVLPIPDDKADWKHIGFQETDRVRFRPARFFIERFKAPVLEAPDLDENGNTVIEKITDGVAPTLQSGCIAGCDVIAAIVVQKYERHMPLHRMQRAFLADQGVRFPVSTLCDWAQLGGTACQRLADALRKHVVDAWLVQTDATGFRVNEPKSGTYKGTVWGFLGRSADPAEPPNVYFEFTPTAEGETGPWKLLGHRDGYILADASNTFDRLFNGKVSTAIEVGCNVHAVREFKKMLPDDPRAAFVVKQFTRIYALEKLYSAQKLTPEVRTAARQERTRPIFEKSLKPYLEKLTARTTPTEIIHKAANYYLKHWDALTRFIDDGRLPLDNNAVESALRPLRLGENNYLFAGSTGGAQRLAAIFSVIATAKQHGLNLNRYLTVAFEEIARRRDDEDVGDLLPHVLKAKLRN